MTVQFTNFQWEPDADVCGIAAGMALGDRFLDLVVTFASDGTFVWDVVEADVLISGTSDTLEAAKRDCENAARRIMIRAL
jgi:hypothetical protein